MLQISLPVCFNNAGHPHRSYSRKQIAKCKTGCPCNFKARRTRVLVATDIAARGIDIDELAHVIKLRIAQCAGN